MDGLNASITESILSTQFYAIGNPPLYLGEVGKVWHGTNRIILSACNPRFVTDTSEHNQARHELFGLCLRGIFHFQEIIAKSGGWAEPGYAVEWIAENFPGSGAMTHTMAESWCLMFQQSAYFFARARQPIRLIEVYFPSVK